MEKKKKEKFDILVLHATELSRIIIARKSVSQKHIVAN